MKRITNAVTGAPGNVADLISTNNIQMSVSFTLDKPENVYKVGLSCYITNKHNLINI